MPLKIFEFEEFIATGPARSLERRKERPRKSPSDLESRLRPNKASIKKRMTRNFPCLNIENLHSNIKSPKSPKSSYLPFCIY